jgi:hypothetical protein
MSTLISHNQKDDELVREAMRLLGSRTSPKKAASSRRNAILAGYARRKKSLEKRLAKENLTVRIP